MILWEITSHETPYSEYPYTFASLLEERCVRYSCGRESLGVLRGRACVL